MKKTIYVLICLLFGLTIILFIRVSRLSVNQFQISDLSLTSPAFQNQRTIPNIYTCTGNNVNPPLVFSNLPESTKSLVITLEDPDAAIKTKFHWILWNIPPENIVVIENTIPQIAVQGTTSFGDRIYRGPCASIGRHHYIFRLYALDTVLNLTREASAGKLKESMKGHIVGRTQLIGIFP